MELSEKQKKLLLSIAREAIKSIFTDEKIPDPDFEKEPLLNTRSGAFVTLTKKGKLRGCIGYIESDRPLFETIRDAAISAAKHDTRFSPVTEKELNEIDLEISILSKPFPMKSYEDIVIGQHGLILEERGRRGLLLPQVPVEHGMNKEEYLDAICNKTGFSSSLWREKLLHIKLFTATVFGEM